ncbi:hypothetical protein N7537_010076 [Penicillium hordei]|uniref:Uncharacterized protein n=1 Tax=Penicillium hordei TaxID=40994 RepID=A0AAD6DVH9_9EURO|nr:uncharacterized protein N7537_010076 [Penicillium hordei]KAJ5593172.1 hypothetical protein N7537_010076 [Penicillium hordei]
MDSTEYANRWNLAKHLHINFLGPVQSNGWPSAHERLFSDVQKLGRRRFDEFMESITIDTLEKPWRNATRNRAVRLSKLAEECMRGLRNESTWRFTIENEIMHRFSVEVACIQCRKRLWESEIPAATDIINSQVESLEARRRKRKPCQCLRSWGQNQDDGGINMLFSNRAEAAIKHYPALEIAAQPGRLKKYEAPDRVYGLKQTDNFKILLDSIDSRSLMTSTRRTLRETIEYSPFSPEGEPLLYPFLIMEAKPSNGAGRAEVDMQTAFCIKRLLKLQYDLRAATGDDTQWPTGPLVWFLNWRGESWDVSVGFPETQLDINVNPEIYYTIVDLWHGDISGLDGALQLLLIVDYIFDWARDIYRPAILGELDVLATGDITAPDPDVFSTMSRRISSWMNASTDIQGTQASFIGEPPDLNYLNIVCQEGVIRDASVIESRYLGLQITENDVDTFLLSFPSAKEANIWVSDVLKCLSGSWRVNAETIDALESFWTVEPRPIRENFKRDEVFYLNMAIHMFVSEMWEPIRQLTCFSITESALRVIFYRIGHIDVPDFTRHPQVGRNAIESLLGRIMKQSIMENLTAVVSMLCMASNFHRKGSRNQCKVIVTRSNGVEAGLRVDKSSQLIRSVISVYESHKIGQREPQDAYIRFSRLQCRQFIQQREEEIAIWPHLPPLGLDQKKKGVLVNGLYQSEECPKHCLYVVNGYDDLEDLPDLLDRMSRDGPYFETIQLRSGQWNEDKLCHMNSPVKPKGKWSTKRDSDSFARWIQLLETEQTQRNYRTGDRSSSPMVLSSDEEIGI